ncbi:hypothetical protein GOP47_0029265 [Adiantum capillus-veneris]|nr:hypothetical protein GOP47_0029265 [Adiantum capillus-veneris]
MMLKMALATLIKKQCFDGLIYHVKLEYPQIFYQQVCPICTFRVFGIRSEVYSDHSFVRFLLEWIEICLLKKTCGTKEDQEGSAPSGEQVSDGKIYQDGHLAASTGNLCVACLGIFQCLEVATEYTPSMMPLKNKESSFSLSKANIIEAVRTVGYRFDSFSLEITVPGVVFVRERAVWQYLQDKHGSQSVLQGKHLTEHLVPLKEALKWALVKPMQEALQAVYDSGSNFKIVLLYKHPETVGQLGFPGCSLKRKRKVAAPTEGSGDCDEPVESLAAIQRCLASISFKDFTAIYSSPPPKCNDACKLDVSCHRSSIFIGGRYLKFSRNVSQSPWLIDEDRKGDGSVQEIIADVVFPHFKADSYKFHASGREDIDVRMLGRGRPFLVEIINAHSLPVKEEIQKLEITINTLKEGWVKVRNLQFVGNDARSHMLEGESEKQKQYTAVIWLSKHVSDAEIGVFTALKDLEIQQKTPVRVLHRRSPLVRPRIIHWLQLERISGGEQYYLLHLRSQAGTYIKEFVHGDLGRTYPNVGSLFGCEAEILQLDVTDIAMDLFD